MGSLSLPAKLSLLAGVFQQAALVLIIRYSKTRNQSQSGGNDNDSIPYLTSVAVMSAEIFKLCLSYILEVITTSRQETSSLPPKSSSSSSSSSIIGRSYSTLQRMLTLNQESIKLIVPALLYVIQNNLLFVALTNLSVPTYQVSNQGKLLTTALISRVLLKKKITTMQYCAITLLGLGVAFVNLSEHQINESSNVTSADGRNQKLGFLAVFISCITSGFAGVYFEFVLKTSKQSVHRRNFQLAFWSCLIAITQIMYNDLQQVKSHGLFHGFDMIVVLVVVAQAMTGFVVSMMIKYADAVLKGFAIAVAAIVAAVASIFLFDTKINNIFFVGALMVAVSVKMYSYFSDEHTSIPIMRPIIYILIFATSSLSLCLLYNVGFHLTPNFQPDAELKDPKGLSLMDLSFSLILTPYLIYRYQVRINLWFRKIYDNKLIMLTATVLSMMSATIITKKIIYPHSCHDQFIMTDVGYMFGTGSGHNMHAICSGKVWEPHVAKAVSEYLYHQGHAIDVGAFYGYHTMRLAKAATPYKVYAFEGRRDAVNILEKNLYRNNAQHLVEVKQEVIDGEWKLSSELETELMKEPLSFIKIDCEGCEIAFLKGAKSVIEKWHPVIVAEIQDDESRNSAVVRLGGQQLIKPIGERSEAIELMRQMGYTVDALVDEYGVPTWDYIALYSGNQKEFSSW